MTRTLHRLPSGLPPCPLEPLLTLRTASCHTAHLAALGESVAVLNGRDVAEEVLATVVRLDESEALLVPPERDAGALACRVERPVPTRGRGAVAAAAAATLLADAARHLLCALFALALVVLLHEEHLGSLTECVAILDRRKVAKKVLATVVGLDEAEALLVPTERRPPGLAAASASASASALGATAAVTSTIPLVVAAHDYRNQHEPGG